MPNNPPTQAGHTFEQVDAKPTPTHVEPEYPGITIDQKFPIISEHSFSEEEIRNKNFDVEVLGFKVGIKKFAPVNIRKDSEVLLKFKALTPNDYWSNLVGTSSLLGTNSKEIYVVSTGPGAVCCTNYWITDVSTGKPRNIFRSEDFGRFREPMEIFDHDGDGVYELVQFDSCFRYFMGDCGSCSPEPRAVFKYAKKTGQYIPVKGVQQEFARDSMVTREKWIREKFEAWKLKKDLTDKLELHDSVLAHVVDLLHLGEEKKAWHFFETYLPDNKFQIRAEINHRLSQCRYYQTLRKAR